MSSLIPVIFGFPKCGTTSLVKFLGGSGIKIESVWDPDKSKKFNEKKHFPIFILRDPVERAWSAYHYFKFAKKEMSLTNYCAPEITKHQNRVSGLWNFAESSNYVKYIEPYLHLNPLVFKLEEISDKLTVENKKDHRDMTTAEREMIEKAVTKENIELYKNIHTSSFSQLLELRDSLNQK